MQKGLQSACHYLSHNRPAQNYYYYYFALNLLHKTLQVWLQLSLLQTAWRGVEPSDAMNIYIQCPVLMTRPNTCTVLNSHRFG